METVKRLVAVKKGSPDYMEEVLTEFEPRFIKACQWARANGYDRVRVRTCELGSLPDFEGSILRGDYTNKE